MPVRLNVVLVHAPRDNPGAQALSEVIVGELIGQPGIDLTLVDPLESIRTDSVDHLSLTSLSGALALLTWQPIDQSVQMFNDLGLDGYRARHAGDPAAAGPSDGRAIFGFDLNEVGTGQQVCGAVQALLQSRQVRTVTLGSLAGKQQPSGDGSNRRQTGEQPSGSVSSVTAPRRQADPPARDDSAGLPEEDSQLADGDSTEHLPGDAGRALKPPLDLDDLVDQLDSLDP